MGLILDSSAAVAAERQRKNPKQFLQAIALETGDDELGVSAVTVLELAHGMVRRIRQSVAKNVRASSVT